MTEISPSKQIKLIKKLVQLSGNSAATPHYLSRTLKIGIRHRFLNHILNPEEG